MNEFSSDLAKLNEKLNAFSKGLFESLENCVTSENHTISLIKKNECAKNQS